MSAISRISGRQLLIIGGALLLGGLALFAAGFTVLALSRAESGEQTRAAVQPADAAPATAASPATTPSATTWTPPPATFSATSAAEGTRAPASSAAPAQTKLDAYRGMGTWVDIYDDRAWKDPAAAVADMAKHGVRTLYIETGNSRSKGEVFKRAQLQQFITEAHARDIKIVAWYLPDMKDVPRDYAPIAAAINLTTPDGQRFDSFALDIESGAVKSQVKRNRALMDLSRQIRALVGPEYPLGAIIPSPVGLSRTGSYWGNFPYTDLATIYDLFVPMGYYTYHGDGAKIAHSDTLRNASILRSKKGCSAVPIHLIGGVAEDSSAEEVAAFVRGSQEAGYIGASFYGWQGTKKAHWAALETFGSGAP